MIRKLSLLLFVIGFIFVVYNGWNYLQATQSVQEIPEKADTPPITPQKNSMLEVKEPTVDPLTLHYDFQEGSEIANLDIPALNKRFTTYWGADERTLQQGVGMYVSEWTTIPNREAGHTVLSGHRDTVFTGLDELGRGDTLVIHYDEETFEYEIKDTWITHADDRGVIVEKEEPTLTLTTCYPFEYIGYAPDRYIVQATLIE